MRWVLISLTVAFLVVLALRNEIAVGLVMYWAGLLR
jgi:hypothetical protein